MSAWTINKRRWRCSSSVLVDSLCFCPLKRSLKKNSALRSWNLHHLDERWFERHKPVFAQTTLTVTNWHTMSLFSHMALTAKHLPSCPVVSKTLLSPTLILKAILTVPWRKLSSRMVTLPKLLFKGASYLYEGLGTLNELLYVHTFHVVWIIHFAFG
jgi:hypothetical protein